MIAYEIRDAAGDLAAIHERHDDPDGSKRFTWRRPDGAVGLNGTPLASLPLYGIDKLGAESIVVVVEGEKTADALSASRPWRPSPAPRRPQDGLLWPS